MTEYRLQQNELDTQLLDFVRSFTRSSGFSPTLEECAANLGVTKTPARMRVLRLVKDGRLNMRSRTARTVRVSR